MGSSAKCSLSIQDLMLGALKSHESDCDPEIVTNAIN